MPKRYTDIVSFYTTLGILTWISICVSGQDYNVTIEVDPDLSNYTVGSTITLECVVDPVITKTSITPRYSWQCDTGCFADGMTAPTITQRLTDSDSGMINCSVTIDGDEYVSDIIYDLQVTEGSKFYIGFISGNIYDISIALFTTSEAELNYTIEAPVTGFHQSGTVTPNVQNFVNLPSSLNPPSYKFNRNNGGYKEGIFSQTTGNKITLIGKVVHSYYFDTFIVIPTIDMCLQKYTYFAVSNGNLHYNQDSVAIVGTANQTAVNIILPSSTAGVIRINNSATWSSLNPETLYSYEIQGLQIVYIAAVNNSLLGTKVITNKPISLFSGHEHGGNQIAEQIPPTELWGTIHYFAPLASTTSYAVNIIAAYDSTNIDIYCNTVVNNYTSNAGESVYITYYNQEFCGAYANKDVLVTQFSLPNSADDEMMVLIPATLHYTNSITSSAFEYDKTDYEHYINIVVLADYFQPEMITITSLGGINQSLESQSWVPIIRNNVTDAYAAQINISPDHLKISHSVFDVIHANKSALMTVVVYGFGGHTAYGHPGFLKSYISRVPTPTVRVTAPNTQTLGQSLTLQCEVTTVRDITSRVDVVWNSGGMELERMNNMSSTTMNNSLVYTHSYTISQLSTTDDGRMIQCEVVINTCPSVMATDSITLDVTGGDYNNCLGNDGDYYNCLGNDTYIFIGNDTSIQKSIFTGGTGFSWKTLITVTSHPLAIDVDIASCTLFYSLGNRNANLRKGKIYAMNLNYSSNNTAIHSGLGYPVQLAVNWVTKKLYWCDLTLSTIEYSDFDGGNRNIMLENVNKIEAIALDPCAEDIYWVSKSNHYVISKMKLDGTNRQVVLSASVQTPNSIVIDFVSSRLYWADIFKIQTSDFEGKGRSTVYSTESRRPTGISLYRNTLYWAEWAFDRITMCTTNGTNVDTLVSNVKRTAAIHILDRSRQSRCC